jgi:hypothetical protein
MAFEFRKVRLLTENLDCLFNFYAKVFLRIGKRNRRLDLFADN